ncbi:MAG: CsgG/HfaB family protein [Gemmatimonadales bacterium]|nr:CsgG/HfaB family protein [Gemmatimonadales bacterium]
MTPLRRPALAALALAALAAVPLRAQQTGEQSVKRIVAVMPFSASPEMYQAWFQARNTNEAARAALEEAVSSAILKTGRFRMMERGKLTQIAAEQGIQKTESFINNDNLVEQGKLVGASFIVAGNIQSVNVNQVPDGDGGVTFDAQIIVSLKVIDVTTAELLAQEQLKLQRSAGLLGSLGIKGAGGHSTPEGAITAAIRDSKPVTEWVSKTFPLQFDILEITERDGPRARKLYIDGGEAMGVKKGIRFDIIVTGTKQIGPKTVTVRQKIGRIRVETPEGDEVAVCLVEEGGDRIAQAFDAKTKMFALSVN